MAQDTGCKVALSLPRRFLGDLAHLALQVPTVPVQRRMHLGVVAAARAVAAPKPSWHALFTKAYALVARSWPQLRQSYLSFPRPQLYEHAVNVASVALARRCLDEEAIFYAPVAQPETLSLVELDTLLRRYKDQSLAKIGPFRRCLRRSQLPQLLRRWLWWWTMNVSGRGKAQWLGTYTVSAYSGMGAEVLHPLSILTSTLTYGVIAPNGGVDVRITYDPRVLDGPTVARVLDDLERLLTHELVAELRYLEAVPEAA